jgi:hypothetical protein
MIDQAFHAAQAFRQANKCVFSRKRRVPARSVFKTMVTIRRTRASVAGPDRVVDAILVRDNGPI